MNGDRYAAWLDYARIDVEYVDALGAPTRTRDEGISGVLRALGYDPDGEIPSDVRALQPVYVVRENDFERLPRSVRANLDAGAGCGYYDLATADGSTRVIVTPHQAYVPPQLQRQKLWGYAAQLYSLRSSKNWGIGDFGDLAKLAELAHDSGASCVALNPLHQGHLTNPAASSPYAPLSRRYLNALYIDVEAAANRCGASLSIPTFAPLRTAPLVDYIAVAIAKIAALERIYAALDERAALRAFEARDAGLRTMALYEAIMESQTARDANIYGWTQWPHELHDRNGPAVAAFERTHEERIQFYIFLQWLADEQLRHAAESAGGMSIGLYRDLAVGVDMASVDVWADPNVFALGLSVGAPPDPLNEDGQNWGLPPFHPRRLAERAYEPFIALLRANMRHAGALRIDHVMGLKRLFCLVRENPKAGGAYVNYDFEALLGIVALESLRHECMIVGEDLGTVPEGFRERINEARVFACRVLFFEREWDGRFRAPDDYTREAVASTGTHDLPTLAGLWTEAGPGDHASTGLTRERLIEALSSAGVLAQGDADRLRGEGADPSIESLTALLVATYRYLGRTRSDLALVQLEDALGQREQVNVPGTVDEQPNWRRRLGVSLEEFERHPLFTAVSRAMRDERPLHVEVL